MLALLARKGELTASELGAPFQISQPTASKHLGVLERAGLLTRKVEGRIHRFRLREGPLNRAESWIARHRTFWAGTLDRLESWMGELERG
jgi:DNA-binding transcriptional ArsR family regulator